MTIHGTADNDRPYDGIDDYYLSIDNMHQYWINRNKTDKLPSIRTFDFNGQTVEHHSYKNGTNNTSIEHYKVINGKHLWFDFLLKNSNTNRLIWDFVSKYDVNGLR